MTLTEATLFGEHTNFWLLRLRFPWMTLENSFDTLRFHWRSPSLCGVYCATGCPQKLTRSLKASYLLQLIFVFLIVERRSQLITYSSPVGLLALSLGVSSIVDWHSGGGVYLLTWSLWSVYYSTAHLARLRLSCVDGEKPQVVLRLDKHSSSVVGQDQALLFQVLESNTCYFSF
jgi:hypothetical protein